MQHSFQINQVLIHGGAIDKDVVKENKSTLAEKWGQSCVHSALEGSWRSRQSEGHHLILKVSLVSLKGSFKGLTIGKPDLMVSRP
jgi:hypothetical protein